jgi:L-lactate dehydrogenase
LTHVAGIPIKDYCHVCKKCDPSREHLDIAHRVRDSAYHIIDYKGSTYYAVGLALTRISGAILRNEHSILTVSLLLNGEYDIKDVSLSVPCILGESGVERIITAPLSENEHKALKASAQELSKVFSSIKI